MIIAIDFDGTCVTHEYPNVGYNIGAEHVIKQLTDAGHQIILFTMRSYARGISPVTGKEESGGLEDAVKWFNDNEIPLFGINENPTQKAWTQSPKPYAQLYIDDAALGCPLIHGLHARPYADWGKIREMLENKDII